MNQFSQCFAT